MSFAERIRRGAVKAPKLWMVTGVQYISNAHLTDTTSRELSNSFGATVPLPEPVAALAMIPAVEFEVAKGRTKASQTISRHSDEKVWAAQFAQLEVKYFKGLENDAGNLSTRRIALQEPVDLGLKGIRGDESPDDTTERSLEKVAEVSGLDTDRWYGTGAEEVTILDEILDADWELFDSYLQK